MTEEAIIASAPTEAELAARNPTLPPDITAISDRKLAGLYWAGHPDDDAYVVNRVIADEIARRGLDPKKYNSPLPVILTIAVVGIVGVGGLFALDWLKDRIIAAVTQNFATSLPLQLIAGALVIAFLILFVRAYREVVARKNAVAQADGDGRESESDQPA